MNSPEYPYKSPGHLTESQLLRYQADEMDAAEMHRVERHLLACALCSDALEGISMLEAKQTGAAVDELKGRLAERLEEQHKHSAAAVYWRWAAAACALLLTAAAVFLLYSGTASINQQLARQEVPENRVPAAPPVIADTNIALPQQPDSTPAQQTAPVKQAAEPAPALAEQKAKTITPETRILGEQEEKPQPISQPQQRVLAKKQPVEDAPAPAVSATQALDGRVAGVTVVQDAASRPSATTTIRIRGTSSVLTNRAKKESDVQENTELEPATALADKADSGETGNSQAYSPSPDNAGSARPVAKIGDGDREVKGKVVEASSGSPIPGVSIRIKGSDKGTVTDVNGEYTIMLPASDTYLTFDFIGFRNKTVVVKPNTTSVTATLEEDVESLSEVVVSGYGNQKGLSENRNPSVSTAPEPAAGMQQFKQWIKENQRYPAAAVEAGVEGVAVVTFFVETDGSLSQLQVQKPLGYGLDEEAIRLVMEGPEWQPATVNAEAIRQKTRVRVPFKLPKSK